MRVVVVPAPIVASGHGTPTVCARHGEQATSHHELVFRSRVPGWLVLLYLVIGPVLAALIAVLIQRKVPTPAWPFCPRCDRSLTVRRVVLAAIFAVAAICGVVGVTGIVLAGDGKSGNSVFALVVTALLIFAGLRAVTLATRGRVANGYVAENGMTVIGAAKQEFHRYMTTRQPVVNAPPPF
jgi:amino acid transporter